MTVTHLGARHWEIVYGAGDRIEIVAAPGVGVAAGVNVVAVDIFDFGSGSDSELPAFLPPGLAPDLELPDFGFS